jgi:hypothetical protein
MKLLVLFLALVACVGAQSVAYTELGKLSFHTGMNASTRLDTPRPQITCRGGNCPIAPDVIECEPLGGDEWDCHAEGRWYGVLERSTISCEGYEHANDSNVLAGSCSIDLDMRDKEHRLPHPADDVDIVLFCIILIIVMSVWYRFRFCMWRRAERRNRRPPSQPDHPQRDDGGAGPSGRKEEPRVPRSVTETQPPPTFTEPFERPPPPAYDEVVVERTDE